MFLSISTALALIVCSLAQAQAVSNPRVSFTTVLERSILLPDDEIPVRFVVSNTYSVPITDIKLTYLGPAFSLLDSPCGTSLSSQTTQTLPLMVPAGSAVIANACLRAGGAVQQGDFTVAFVLHYSRDDNGRTVEEIETAEQTIHVGLFGIESAGGISLRLAALLLPGLLFLLTLRLGGIEQMKELDTTATVALSVVLSVLLTRLWSYFWPRPAIGLVSLDGLLVLSGFALAAGIVLTLVYRHVRRWNKRRRTVRVGEDTASALSKALSVRKRESRKKDDNPVVKFELSNKLTLVGSCYAPTTAGYALFGWYAVDHRGNGDEESPKKGEESRKGLERHAGNPLKLLRIARKRKLAMSVVRNLQMVNEKGGLESHESAQGYFGAAEVKSLSWTNDYRLGPVVQIIGG